MHRIYISRHSRQASVGYISDLARIWHLRRDFDRPNAFAVRFSSVHFGRMRGQTRNVSLRFNMASVDIKKKFENKTR